jgi:hypothetical protein
VYARFTIKCREMAAAEQPNAGNFTSAQAERVSDSPTAGGPGPEGESPVAFVEPERPAYDEVEIPRGHWPPLAFKRGHYRHWLKSDSQDCFWPTNARREG